MRQNWRGGRWQNVVRGEKIDGFKHWSNIETMDIDRQLKDQTADFGHEGLFLWLMKWMSWSKCAIFQVKSLGPAKYRVGFIDGDICKLSKVVLSLDTDQKFALREGPRQLKAFIVSTHPVELHLYSHAKKGSKIDIERYDKIILL